MAPGSPPARHGETGLWEKSEGRHESEGLHASAFGLETDRCFVLSQVPLGHHKEKYFSSPKAKAVLSQFQTDLENLEREITARNAQVDLPYDYLRPSRIENSVTI